MHAKLLFACILHIIHGYNNACPDNLYAHQIADNAIYYSELDDVSVETLIVTGYDESHFKQYAKSSKGALGIYQIKRHGAIQGADLKLSYRELTDIAINTRIASHYMGTLNKKCLGRTTWVSIYNTGHGRCRSTAYSRKISADLRQGLKWEKELFQSPIAVGEYIISP